LSRFVRSRLDGAGDRVMIVVDGRRVGLELAKALVAAIGAAGDRVHPRTVTT
jgi:hypothetical protein